MEVEYTGMDRLDSWFYQWHKWSNDADITNKMYEYNIYGVTGARKIHYNNSKARISFLCKYGWWRIISYT